MKSTKVNTLSWFIRHLETRLNELSRRKAAIEARAKDLRLLAGMGILCGEDAEELARLTEWSSLVDTMLTRYEVELSELYSGQLDGWYVRKE